MSMDPLDFIEPGESDCCGARILQGGICADCKEHCEATPEEKGDAETASEGLGQVLQWLRDLDADIQADKLARVQLLLLELLKENLDLSTELAQARAAIAKARQ